MEFVGTTIHLWISEYDLMTGWFEIWKHSGGMIWRYWDGWWKAFQTTMILFGIFSCPKDNLLSATLWECSPLCGTIFVGSGASTTLKKPFSRVLSTIITILPTRYKASFGRADQDLSNQKHRHSRDQEVRLPHEEPEKEISDIRFLDFIEFILFHAQCGNHDVLNASRWYTFAVGNNTS